MGFDIQNRRYTGSKQKLVNWITASINKYCSKDCKSFCDLFAGTGVVTNAIINSFDEFYVNDFLYSNNIIYEAFFSNNHYNESKLIKFKREFEQICLDDCKSNYVSDNYGGKFFSQNDSILIGEIRERIEDLRNRNEINYREFCILLASLMYSLDRCSNTVGHYEAYIKKPIKKDSFVFELINPVIFKDDDQRKIHISRKDSNILAQEIYSDIVYIDPPYSSRQYSRFYHVLETITKWDKPKLYGTALKPEPENMSEYCCSKAIDSFRELISDLKCRYIIVSYNNTYNSKSKSSQNKMELDDMLKVLEKKGRTIILEKKYNAFNAGKTELKNHKEYLFITEVEHE